MKEQLEMDGISDINKKKQSKSQPIIDGTFIGTRIEQLWAFIEFDGITKSRWCKGTVVSVLSN